MKTCSKCGVEQPESEFYKSPKYKDGLTQPCRTCRKKAMRSYLDKNPMCSHCGIRPHQPNNAICYECQRELRGDVNPPKFRRDTSNKTMCCKCKIRPRLSYHNYCAICKNETHRKFIKSKGGDWAYILSLGKREQKIAHAAVQRALKSGKLIKPELCEICGSKVPLEGHHYLGYSKEYRLMVLWVCNPCHTKAHKKDIDME